MKLLPLPLHYVTNHRLRAVVFASIFVTACGGGADHSDAADAAAPAAATAAASAAAGDDGGRSTALADTSVGADERERKANVRTGAVGSKPPIVFNVSASVGAGQIISLQGANFGSAPRVALDSAPTGALEIVNRVGDSFLAVQIPASAKRGALALRIYNGANVSAQVKLNAARPLHLDTLQLVPGGGFRVFGRNLVSGAEAPRITIDGLNADIDLTKSDEHMLTATAPAALRPTARADVRVDNGNGSSFTVLDRTIEVVASGSGDPFALGVGWAAAFSAISPRVLDAASDQRLQQKVVCDGVRDDAPAVQRAIDLAAADGGGVVRLPAGRCRMAGGMELRSKVVVQGAGKNATTLVYESNYPLFAHRLDLAGVRNLTLANAGPVGEGPLLKESTRVFLQNVGVQLGTSRQMYLTGNRHFVVANCDFVQAGSISHQGPYILEDSAGLVFEGNTTQWVDGAPAFGRVHDSLIRGNRFTRDARQQNAPGTVHSLTLDFAHRVAVVGNTLDVLGGPITNTLRNDGEALLTEGGGNRRTENLGQVASADSRTLTDASNTLQTDPFGTAEMPENYGVAIVAGTGAGQTRRVVAYTRPMLTVDRAWDVVPDSTSRYATFVWGLEKALIKDNVLLHNPRGIWLYHTAVRDVEIVGNTITDGGGIYLRSYQKVADKRFMPIYNVLIAGNRISNTGGHWGSYINAVFVNADAQAFGIATIGIEVRDNTLIANRPNWTTQREEYANVEGYMNMMRVENYQGYDSAGLPRLLGSMFNNNVCTHCDVGVRIGTGASGTTIVDTRQASAVMSDWATTSTPERASGTVQR